MNNKIDKYAVGLAGEYFVASELCRRGINASITLGNAKRIDILAFSEKGKIIRIEVKSKQGRNWAGVKGIPNGDYFIVFVDYYNKESIESPDMYILNSNEWVKCVKRKAKERKDKGQSLVTMSPENVPIFSQEIARTGKVREGMTVPTAYVEPYKNKWETITKAVHNA